MFPVPMDRSSQVDGASVSLGMIPFKTNCYGKRVRSKAEWYAIRSFRLRSPLI
jgi:hypothetical protein